MCRKPSVAASLVSLALMLSGCLPFVAGSGSSSTQYYFAGERPSQLAGVGTESADVRSQAEALLTGRAFFFGLHRGEGVGHSTTNDVLRSGPANSALPPYSSPESNRPDLIQEADHGQAAIVAGTLTMTLALAGGQTLTLAMNSREAQGLVNEVRRQERGGVSSGSLTAAGRLTGDLDGTPVDITFTQQLRGRSSTSISD